MARTTEGEDPPAAEPAPGPAPDVPIPAARNAALLLVAEVIGKVSTFAFTVIAARTLARADFGAFNYALAFSLLVITVPKWGFNAILVREGSRRPRALAVLYSEALAWRAALLVPTVAMATVFAFLTRPNRDAAVAVLLMLVAATADLYSETGKSVAAVRGRLSGWATAIIVNRVVSSGAAIALLAGGFGLVGLATGYMAGSLLGAAWTAVAVARLDVKASLSAVTSKGLARMGRSSFAIGVNSLVAMTLARIDTVILAAMRGDRDVAVYMAGYRLVETVLFATWTLNAVVLPRASAARSNEEVRRVTERAIGAVSTVFVPFGVILLVRGSEVAGFVFGGQYEEPVKATVRWLSGAPIGFAVGFFASAALIARGRSGKALAASTIAAGANVAANLVLVPRYGPAGAAFVTTATYALEAVVLLVFCRVVIGWLDLFRPLLVPTLASAPLVAALLVVPGSVVTAVCVGGTLYSLAWLLLSRRFDPATLELLRAAARRSAKHAEGRAA